MTDTGGIAADQLRAFVERIERLEEEKKAISDDIGDVYSASSVYSMLPITEELGRDFAARYGDPRPVRPVGYRIEDQSVDTAEDDL